MRRTTTALLAITLGVLMVLLAGCSKDSPSNPGTVDQLNLTSQFGGYTTSDEPAAFGDPEIAGMMEQDPECDDPAISAGAADSLRRLHGATVYAMAIRWGMLLGDSTVTVPTDWSGSLSITHGAIHIVRTLQFEEHQDHIVRPRTSRSELAWVSQTAPSFDGILVTIIVPPAPPDSDWSNNQVSFQTTPYSRIFSLSELNHLNEIVDVGTDGNQVAFNATNITADSCGSGQLEGKWVLNPSHKNGHFLGKWMNEDGLMLGLVRGHFGARPDSSKVFFGKFIGLEGHFRGLIRGNWAFDLGDSTQGTFDGIFAGRGGQALGELHGQWGSLPPDSTVAVGREHGNNGNMHGRGHDRDPKEDMNFGTNGWIPGFFSGQWQKTCGTDSTGGG
ncbi:MAG: hypothetical protein HZB43_01460 [candidate division Zixibacteria bacterium]|nr:hypothetical protein [candidate division Zixibacteria bacterium]